LRIWSIARSQTELQTTMCVPLEGTEEGLVFYWPMDEGMGPVVRDKGSSGNTGTLVNVQWMDPDFCEHGRKEV